MAEDADLGAAAKKVNGCDTPHKAQTAPGLSLVLFAKLDKESAEKAEKAVGKVKGVDGKGSKADPEKGEVSIKLDGKAKVTVADLTKALDGAGIKASIKK